MSSFGQTVKSYPMRRNGQTLPLVVESRGDRGVAELADWVGENRDELESRLGEYGAVLFRGFGIEGPRDFEKIALNFEPELEDEYLGTSPRESLTDYVYEASGLPGYYPIPQHCEMTFVKNPPRRLFFSCLTAPTPGTGQTPLVDFRKVYRQMDDDVLQRFVDGGIRIIRNYSGPETPSGFDLWELKRWDDIFGTEEKSVVEQKCDEQGFDWTWRDEDRLRLVHDQDAVREHPESGEPVWFNHSQVFHLSAAPGEFKRIFFNAQSTPKIFGLWQVSRAMVWMKRNFTETENQALHCTYRDGTEIPLEDMEHLRDVIWENMVAYSWQPGDIVAIDNFSVSHGRLPFSGDRRIAVAWAE